ncbi:hypothetical protein WMR74_001490 [Providencia rettgeri]|uniref:hypothetical protein n=1 Tax=Providencia sp. TaxID=589 RepID=UPI0030C49D41
MKLIIHGEASEIERIAINAALSIHDNRKKGFRVNHRVKIKNKIYHVEIENCPNSLRVTMRNKRQRL